VGLRETFLQGNVEGSFAKVPSGMILHGTRSGQPYAVDKEYMSTINYVTAGASGLGWNATVGDGVICWHMPVTQWAYNARESSDDYGAVEIAQSNIGVPITDRQIEGIAKVWVAFRNHYGPSFPMYFVNHSELPAGIRDGKTDVEPLGYHSVKDRVISRLKKAGYR
jgi:hypothetical protein